MKCHENARYISAEAVRHVRLCCKDTKKKSEPKMFCEAFILHSAFCSEGGCLSTPRWVTGAVVPPLPHRRCVKRERKEVASKTDVCLTCIIIYCLSCFPSHLVIGGKLGLLLQLIAKIIEINEVGYAVNETYRECNWILIVCRPPDHSLSSISP